MQATDPVRSERCVPWVPDSPEDSLQVAFGELKRVLRDRLFGGEDPAVFGILHAVATLGQSRVSAVAERVGLDVSTVSRHVRSLETSGWIERTDDPDDRRAALLRLTESGHTHLHDTIARRSTLMRTAMQQWSDHDRRDLTRLLARLADDLDDARIDTQERS